MKQERHSKNCIQKCIQSNQMLNGMGVAIRIELNWESVSITSITPSIKSSKYILCFLSNHTRNIKCQGLLGLLDQCVNLSVGVCWAAWTCLFSSFYCTSNSQLQHTFEMLPCVLAVWTSHKWAILGHNKLQSAPDVLLQVLVRIPII